MRNKLCTISLFLLMITPGQVRATALVCDLDLSASVLPSMDAVLDYLIEIVGDAVDEFTDIFTDESLELKITDATQEAESRGQNAIIGMGFQLHGQADEAGKNGLIYGPLSQSDFACTAECMGRTIVEGYTVPTDAASELSNAAAQFDREFVSWNDLNKEVSNTYRNASSNGLADARRILPTGNTLTAETDELAAQIITLTNPTPTFRTETFGEDNPGRKRYQTLEGLKRTAIAVTQRILSRQGGDVYPGLNLQNDPWYGEIKASLGGDIGDLDLRTTNGDQSISGDGALALQVKSRYSNANWHIDLHRKTEVGGLRTIAAMNAVQLELKRQLHIANQDIMLLQAIFNGLETTSYYKGIIDNFSAQSIIQ